MVGIWSIIVSLSLVPAGFCDPIDWVNINYVTRQSKSNGVTSNSQIAIASKGSGSAKAGPWTIQTKDVLPPSGSARDYLSWAPYHWPDCNWCSRGSTHYVSPNGTYDGPDDGGGDTDDQPEGDGPDDSSDEDSDGKDESVRNDAAADLEDLKSEIVMANFITGYGDTRDRMRRVPRRQAFNPVQLSNYESLPVRRDQLDGSSSSPSSAPSSSSPTSNFASVSFGGVPPTPAPTIPPTGVANVPQVTNIIQSSSTSDRVVGTQAPAEAPAKTQQGKCTPSPTKSLAPSATWTTCPYVVRDGKVNSDTNLLKGPDAAQDMSQSVIYNAVAYALQKTSSSSQNVVKAIDAFFLSPTTGMNPNVNFGQLVRGPGKDHQVGTFTGILDLRGMVKVSNAVQLMRTTKSPDWTSGRESAMTGWAQSYVSWLQNSNIGKSTASKANNHLTFYVAQLSAVQYLLGDTKGSAATVQKYFSNQFLDQIAQSGEQPFESVRTRPYHYRCFNLEAMIANAKIGDQLGLNMWTSKSKYGATIQTAIDYTMALDPKGEDISDIFPHVAAVAAAYGDPKGKYAAFLQKNDPNHKSQPYWFFDQSGALPNSPAGKSVRGYQVDDDPAVESISPDTASLPTPTDPSSAPDSEVPVDTEVPFECPAVFKNAEFVELEYGLFVTCDQLKPFYELPKLAQL